MAKQQNGGTALSTEQATVEDMMAAAGSMVQKASAATIAKSYEGLTIEQIVKIEPGQTISGIYRGLGQVASVADPQDPTVMRDLQTFRIQNPANPKVIALVLESSQVGRFLRSIPVGSRVSMTLLGQVAGRNGRRVNQWVLGHESPAANVIDAAAVG